MKLTAALLSLILAFSGHSSMAQSSASEDPCGKLEGYNIGLQAMNRASSQGLKKGDGEFAIAVILISAYVTNLKAEKLEVQANSSGQYPDGARELMAEARALRESASRECNASDIL